MGVALSPTKGVVVPPPLRVVGFSPPGVDPPPFSFSTGGEDPPPTVVGGVQAPVVTGVPLLRSTQYRGVLGKIDFFSWDTKRETGSDSLAPVCETRDVGREGPTADAVASPGRVDGRARVAGLATTSASRQRLPDFEQFAIKDVRICRVDGLPKTRVLLP